MTRRQPDIPLTQTRDTSRLQADLENTNAEGGRIRQKFGWLNRPNKRRRDMELLWEIERRHTFRCRDILYFLMAILV